MKRIINILFFLFCFFHLFSVNNIVSKTQSPISDLVIVSVKDLDGKCRFYELDSVGALNSIDVFNSIVISGGEISYPYLSYDGRVLYFSAKVKNSTNFDIYYSVYEDDKWGDPISAGTVINSFYDDISPVISASGNDLYFVRKRNVSNNKHNKDAFSSTIFLSSKNDLGYWSVPSAILISGDCDMTPILLSDDETLIFSSRRDIQNKKSKFFELYYSKRLYDNNWLDPILLSDNVNTNESKLYPFYSYKENKLYYVSTKRVLRNSHADVHNKKLPVIQIEGRVKDFVSSKDLKANITILDALTNQPLLKKISYKDGFFAFPLNRGRDYIIDIHKDGYTHQFSYISAFNLKKDSSVYIDAKLSDNLKLSLNIFDKLIYFKIPATISITNFYDKPYYNLGINNTSSSSPTVNLPLGNNYRIHINADGYFGYSIDLPKDKPIQFNKSMLDIELNPIIKPVIFKVIDKVTRDVILADINISNLKFEEFKNIKVDNHAIVDLRAALKYELTTTSPGYIFNIMNLDVSRLRQNDTCLIEMIPIKSGEIVQIDNVNFAYNSSELLVTSLKAIDNVVNLLRLNPELKIQLAAHTDDIGGNLYNLNLSNARAQSVMNYLIDQGIDPSRLESKGYGMSEPLVSNDSEENRAKNRRVEFRIL